MLKANKKVKDRGDRDGDRPSKKDKLYLEGRDGQKVKLKKKEKGRDKDGNRVKEKGAKKKDAHKLTHNKEGYATIVNSDETESEDDDAGGAYNNR